MQDAPFKYPRAAVGQIFALSAMVSGVAAWITGPRHELVTPTLQTLCVVYTAIAWGYFLWSIYRIHKILRQATNGRYPIRPWKAVGLDLVPFYNVYWAFKWTGEVAAFLNHARRQDRFPLDRWGWILFAAFIPGSFVPGLPLVISFIAIGRIAAKTQITLAARTLPIETYERETYRKMTGVVAACIAAVAIVIGSVAVVIASAFLRQPAGRGFFLAVPS